MKTDNPALAELLRLLNVPGGESCEGCNVVGVEEGGDCQRVCVLLDEYLGGVDEKFCEYKHEHPVRLSKCVNLFDKLKKGIAEPATVAFSKAVDELLRLMTKVPTGSDSCITLGECKFLGPVIGRYDEEWCFLFCEMIKNFPRRFPKCVELFNKLKEQNHE